MEAETTQSKGKLFIVAFEEDWSRSLPPTGVGGLDLLAQVVRHPDVELQLLLARRRFVQASCRNVIRGLDDLIPRLRRFE
jgi:hypothetical protein